MAAQSVDITRFLASTADDTTTRSLLTTVFGDALLTRGQPCSVVDLAMLLAPLGVNERSVRTSLLRLSREELVASVRDGRHSLYSVAPEAIDTFTRAEPRIYSDVSPAWDGQWTVAIIEPNTNSPDRSRFQSELRWMGMATLQAGVLASPTIETHTVSALAAEHRVTLTALFRSTLADGQLDGDPQLAAFTDPSGQLHELHESHIEKWAAVSGSDFAPDQSFAARTALLDDWRRIALRTLDAPRELLPDTWLGDTARTVTSDLYGQLFESSEAFLDERLGSAKSIRTGFSPTN